MKLELLLDKIFEHPALQSQPPVLLDIGASGDLHHAWKPIAKYAVCIAFDADDRDIAYINQKKQYYKELHLLNKIVVDSDNETTDFYLTKSPYCSSLLKPDENSLSRWQFGELFAVEKKVTINSISLKKALAGLNIGYVDWFKSDSQGTDLRLFKNIEHMQSAVLLAEFEPGIADIYEVEDKVVDILAYMSNKPFWLSHMVIHGNYWAEMARLNAYFNTLELQQLFVNTPNTPLYAEMSYFNDFTTGAAKTERNFLLACTFGILQKQYAFTAGLALESLSNYQNPLFESILQFIKQTTKRPSIGTFISQPSLLKKKIANRLIRFLQKHNAA